MSLLSNLFIFRDEKDACIWKFSTSEWFSSKSFVKALSQLPIIFLGLTFGWVWFLELEVFCWFVIVGKISIVDNL